VLTSTSFRPGLSDERATRAALGVGIDRKLCSTSDGLAKEKNTATLFRAFEILQRRRPDEFHLLVIGDGTQRSQLRKLQMRCKTFPGSAIVPSRTNWPLLSGGRSFVHPACRKLSVWLR